MFNTSIQDFWPNYNENYLEALIGVMRKKRLDCLEYINTCSLNELNNFCEYTRCRLKEFYKTSKRPEIINTIEKELSQYTWGIARTLEMILSNGRRQTIIIGVPNICDNKKVIIAIHGTHENARYFLGQVKNIRQGHECAVGFMLPFIYSGYIVVCTELPCFGEDYPHKGCSTSHFTDYIMQVDYISRLTGFSYMNEVLYRHMAVIDYLSKEYRSMKHCSITGYSLGAESALCVCACDERIDSVIEYLGTSTFESRIAEMAINRKRSQVFGSGFINSIGDYWCLGISVYPRPYCKFSRNNDRFVNYSSVKDMVKLYEVLYARKEKKACFKHIVKEGGHFIDIKMAEEGVEWLECQINKI